MEDRDTQQERERLATYGCPPVDGRDDSPVGVLLSDEIKRCVTRFRMIDPFEELNLLKPAGYELSIGDEYIFGGVEEGTLKKDGEIRIRPFNVVVIKTAETINLPRLSNRPMERTCEVGVPGSTMGRCRAGWILAGWGTCSARSITFQN